MESVLADRRQAHRRPAGRRHRPGRPELLRHRRPLPRTRRSSAPRSASFRRSNSGASPSRCIGSARRLGRGRERPSAGVHPARRLPPLQGRLGFRRAQLLNGKAIGIFHLNDYPSTPTRDKITDADRVYPGDGIAPLKETSATCATSAFAACCRWSCSTATTGSRTRCRWPRRDWKR